ncbi:hypothetical protein G6F40_014844 [Rhizopus arrhizus]|nr:hypothetical protein G6F40_014844 [Rhizopus arrhizus]
MDHGRLPAQRRHAQPLLRAARHRTAAGAAAAGGAAPRRAARSGLEQPGWRGDQEGPEGQPLVAECAGRWHSVPPVLHAQGWRRRRLPADHRGLHHLLRARFRRPVPGTRQLHRGQPPGHPGTHQAGLVLHAVLRDVARGAEQAGRRAGEVLGHRDPVPGAVAGQGAGECASCGWA